MNDKFLAWVLIIFASFDLQGQTLGKVLPKREYLTEDTTVKIYYYSKLMDSVSNIKDKAQILNTLLAYSIKGNLFDTVKQSYKTVSSQIKNEYFVNAFSSDDYSPYLGTITDATLKANKLEKDKIGKGRYIAYPKLPLSYQGNDDPMMQSKKDDIAYIDIVKSNSYNKSNEFVFPDIGETYTSYNPVGVKCFAYVVSSNDYSKFYQQANYTVNKYINNGIYIQQPLENIKISLPVDTVLHKEYIAPPLPASKILLSEMADSLFGKFYVLDVFDGNKNMHGMKVLDVIKKRFSDYNLDSVYAKNIIQIPINYYQNIPIGLAFLKKYYNQFDTTTNYQKFKRDRGMEIVHSLEKLSQEKIYLYSREPENTVENYLYAVFSIVYNYDPDVISTSFYRETFESRFVPYGNSNVNLITAGTNSYDQDIMSLKNADLDTKENSSTMEPLYSYWLSYRDFGNIIVGNCINHGVYSGMYSSDGARVTTLGIGIGWQGKYIQNTDCGTSFATPDVAASVYLAKAYWRKVGNIFSPIDTRFRLLLSTNLDSAFAGKFGSAGTVNFNKLLVSYTDFAQKINGKIDTVRISDSSKIKYINDAGEVVPAYFSYLPHYAGKYPPKLNDNSDICGLYNLNKNIFIFSKNELKWKKVILTECSVYIYIDNNSIPHKIDLNEFVNEYASLVITHKS